MGGVGSMYGNRTGVYRVLVGKPEGRNHLEDLGVDGRRIFGPKRDEVTRERRKLHNEKLNDLYSSPNFVRV